MPRDGGLVGAGLDGQACHDGTPPATRPATTSAHGRTPLAGQNDEWTEARRYMGPEILAACRKPVINTATSEPGVTIETIGVSIKQIARWSSHTPSPWTWPR
jgi:hypothetical protein